jgi:hypothetical protein
VRAVEIFSGVGGCEGVVPLEPQVGREVHVICGLRLRPVIQEPYVLPVRRRPAMRCDHPFAVDVRRTRIGPLGFSWSIRERGTIKERSHEWYGTFEEARVALQSALARHVTRWKAAQLPALGPILLLRP